MILWDTSMYPTRLYDSLNLSIDKPMWVYLEVQPGNHKQ